MKNLFLLLLTPLAAFSSTVYTFSLPYTSTQSAGFTYVSSTYLQASPVTLGTQDFASCDVSAFSPSWICASATLTQLAGGVSITATFRSTTQPNDPSGTSQAIATFAGASLGSDGSYRATIGSPNPAATFSIQTTTVATPEPATWALLGIGLGGAWLWKRRKAESAC